MVRGRASGQSALCPYKMYVAPTLTSEFAGGADIAFYVSAR
jgi:hypothetical protein